MLSPGCGGGAKSKGALYRETLQTTGFYVGRIVIVTREFTPIPSPPLRCLRFRESRRLPGMRLARILIIICQPSQGGEGKRHITSGIGDGEVVEVGKQSVVRPCRPRSVGILSLPVSYTHLTLPTNRE